MTILAMPALKEVARSPAAPFSNHPKHLGFAPYRHLLQRKADNPTWDLLSHPAAADWSLPPSTQSPEDNTGGLAVLWLIKCSLDLKESIHVISAGDGWKPDCKLGVYASKTIKRIRVFIEKITIRTFDSSVFSENTLFLILYWTQLVKKVW